MFPFLSVLGILYIIFTIEAAHMYSQSRNVLLLISLKLTDFESFVCCSDYMMNIVKGLVD